MEPPRRPPDLEGAEARRRLVSVAGEDVADEESQRPDEVVAEGADGVDGDADAGGVAGEKLRRHAEEELVVPGWVVAAELVNASSELRVGVDPRDGVGLEPSPRRRRRLQALRGDQVDLQYLMRLRRRWHSSLFLEPSLPHLYSFCGEMNGCDGPAGERD